MPNGIINKNGLEFGINLKIICLLLAGFCLNVATVDSCVQYTDVAIRVASIVAI